MIMIYQYMTNQEVASSLFRWLKEMYVTTTLMFPCDSATEVLIVSLMTSQNQTTEKALKCRMMNLQLILSCQQRCMQLISADIGYNNKHPCEWL